MLCVHVRFLGKVYRELRSDHHVVFHATHLSTERRASLAKHTGSLLELQRVNGELLEEPLRVGRGVLGEERLQDVQAALLEHDRGHCAHCVLDFLGREDAEALGGVVYAVPRPGDPAQRALVVLRLEAEVALAHDDDLRVQEAGAASDAVDVSRHEHELLARVCERESQCVCVC